MKSLPLLLLAARVSAAGERGGTLSVGLVPRHDLVGSAALAKRAGPCSKGFHNCLGIGREDQCCDNQSYCYVNKVGAAKCCPVGSNCVNDSFCRSDSFFCKAAVTTADGDGPGAAVETSVDGCCQRLCPQTSHFLCPQTLGGKCCPYGAECRAGEKCLETVTATATTTASTARAAGTAPGAGRGCSASQYRCADGTGCCDAGQRCTRLSGTAYCAATASPTGDAGAAPPPGPGLSGAAKAAMGTTVALAATFILAAAAWLCISTRRRRRRGHQRAAAELSAGPGPDGPGPAEMRGMSDANLRPRPRPGRGLTEAYLGPSPVAGPYTDAATLDELRMSLPGLARAGPTRPDRPGDIVAPVEMDSNPGPFELDAASRASVRGAAGGSRACEKEMGAFY